MNGLRCVGLSHRSASLDVRERLAVPLRETAAVLDAVRALPGVHEAVVVSTCNRVELYAAVDTESAGDPAQLLEPLLARAGFPDVAGAVYRHEAREAARHLFRVACGLDSLVVGETQILGQVREAYGAAAAAGATGRRLNPLFQQALANARTLHATTRIGAGRVSVAGVAVDLARRVFGALGEITALLVGTGETGRLTLQHLRDAGVGTVRVASRSADRARALAAETGAAAVTGPLADELPSADLVVTAVGDAAGTMLPPAELGAALRRRKQRPIVVVDLGVPRNVPEASARLDNVYYYDVDALESVVQANLRERSSEVAACETAVGSAVEGFWRRYGDPDVEQTLAALSQRLTAVGETEVAALLDGLGDVPPEARDRIAQAARRLVNRLLHRPLSEIKRAAANGGAGELTDAARRLFQLDGPGEDAPAAEADPPAAP